MAIEYGNLVEMKDNNKLAEEEVSKILVCYY